MGDEQHRAVEAVERRLELLDRRRGRGGWSARRARGSWRRRAISSASTARVRSPGDSVAAGRSTWSAPRPNLASSVRASLTRHARSRPRTRRAAAASPASRPRACSTSPTHDAGPSVALDRRRAASDRASRRATSSCRCRWRRRSRPARRTPTVRSIGPSVKSPRSTTTSSRRAHDVAAARRRAAIVRRSSHASHGLSTSSRRSIAARCAPPRPASCSVWLMLEARGCSCPFVVRIASSPRLRPCAAHSRSRWRACGEAGALRVVLVEALPRRGAAARSRSSR